MHIPYTYMHIHTCTYIHTYIHAHTYMYIHTYRERGNKKKTTKQQCIRYLFAPAALADLSPAHSLGRVLIQQALHEGLQLGAHQQRKPDGFMVDVVENLELRHRFRVAKWRVTCTTENFNATKNIWN